MPERFPADDPREWVNRAHSDLILAKTKNQTVYLEDLCFHAQQAAEKAIKSVLIKHNVKFPHVHDIAERLTLLEKAGCLVPEFVRQAERLTRFAVFTRYPGIAPPLSDQEHEEAVHVAEYVVCWAEEQL